MLGNSAKDLVWIDIKLAADYVSARVSSTLGELKVITLWTDHIATTGPRNVIAISGDSVRAAGFSRDAIVGILAHEAAHLYLRQSSTTKGTVDEEEREADRIAIAWGFRDELCTFFNEYAQNRERLGWMKIREPPADCAQD